MNVFNSISFFYYLAPDCQRTDDLCATPLHTLVCIHCTAVVIGVKA